ncbi:MAG: hypothetical protein JJD97_12260 [Gemmatimonadaceae bacterium]|nr:hypothetical protein [Gemmatimonadaceae bacterium]
MPARLTPYELILEPLERDAFPAIRAEGEQRGSDVHRRDQFLLLGHAGAALDEMVSEDADPASLDEYGELLYQGFQFWSYGRRLYSFEDSATSLVTDADYAIGDWILAGPPACYLQFPYQRLWARVSASAQYEPLDGIFAVAAETESKVDSGTHLRMQMVLGLRPDRPGVSLVSYRDDLDPAKVAARAEHPWRADGAPYANLIPGGERMGYRTLATRSELEALVIRSFHYLDTHLDRLEKVAPIAGAESTHLPCVRVR